MTHKEVLAGLEPYLRGDLPEGERQAIADHLSSCSTCAREAAQMEPFLRRLKTGLKTWVEGGEVPGSVEARILASAGPGRRRSSAWTWLAGLAAVAVLVFGLVTWSGGGGLGASLFGRPTHTATDRGITVTIRNIDRTPDAIVIDVNVAGTHEAPATARLRVGGTAVNASVRGSRLTFTPAPPAGQGVLEITRVGTRAGRWRLAVSVP